MQKKDPKIKNPPKVVKSIPPVVKSVVNSPKSNKNFKVVGKKKMAEVVKKAQKQQNKLKSKKNGAVGSSKTAHKKAPRVVEPKKNTTPEKVNYSQYIPEISRNGGRPPKYKTVPELEKLIDAYFESCWSQKTDMFGNPIFLKDEKGKKTNVPVMIQHEPYLITGLALSMGMTRQMLREYEGKDKFGYTIKRAKERCQRYAEQSLFIGKNPTGAIFNLKNNYQDWKDKTETEHSGNLVWKEEPPK